MLFGRWGFAAFLSCIRDGSVDDVVDLANLVCSGPLDARADEVVDSTHADLELFTAVVNEVTDEAVGADLTIEVLDHKLQDLEAKVRPMLLAPTALLLPCYVRNSLSLAGIIHVPKTLWLTLSAWSWGTCRAVVS
eukprot:6471652-Amphidinium_carterae.2